MTCSNCTKDHKCPSCEIKDMGFVQKSDIEGMIKQLHAEPNGNSAQDKHFNGDIDAFLDHTMSCSTPSCQKIAGYINRKNEDAYYSGVQTGSL